MSIELVRRLMDLERRLERLATVESGRAAGTFTPAFSGSATPGTITHTTQTGRYTRIGNRVEITVRITISTISVAPTGDLIITGLPFTSTATAYAGTCAIGFLNQITFLAGTRFAGATIGSATTHINLTEIPSAGSATNIPASALGANAWAVLGGSYEVG